MRRGIAVARRHFLKTAGLALAAMGLGRVGSLLLPDRESTAASVLGRRIVALLGSPASARVVGREYLRRWPREANIALLVSSVIGDRTLDDARGLMAEPKALYNTVHAERQRDFENGELIAIGGWYLARSEARICGLAQLL